MKIKNAKSTKFCAIFPDSSEHSTKKAKRQNLMPIAGKQSGKAQHKKQGKKEEYEDEDDREFKRKQREAAEKTKAAAAQLQASKK